jgi:hypothetical protein
MSARPRVSPCSARGIAPRTPSSLAECFVPVKPDAPTKPALTRLACAPCLAHPEPTGPCRAPPVHACQTSSRRAAARRARPRLAASCLACLTAPSRAAPGRAIARLSAPRLRYLAEPSRTTPRPACLASPVHAALCHATPRLPRLSSTDQITPNRSMPHPLHCCSVLAKLRKPLDNLVYLALQIDRDRK